MDNLKPGIETYQPSNRITAAGGAAEALIALPIAFAFGCLYGFSFAIWKTAGEILFFATGLMAIGAVVSGCYIGKVRNPVFSAILSPLCFLAIVLTGNLIAFKIFGFMDRPIMFYIPALIINFAGSIAGGYAVVSELLMFDEQNRSWYKKRDIGFVSLNDLHILQRILRKEINAKNISGVAFHPAIGVSRENLNYIEVSVKISVPGSPVYLVVDEHSTRGQQQAMRSYEGFIPWLVASEVEDKIRQAMQLPGAYAPKWLDRKVFS
jgi:hypothetical protein